MATMVRVAVDGSAERDVIVRIQGRILLDRLAKRWTPWENIRSAQDRIMVAGQSRTFYVYPGQRIAVEELDG